MNDKDKYVPDYRIDLISPAKIKDFEKLHTELREAMKFVKYSKDKKCPEKLMTDKSIIWNKILTLLIAQEYSLFK